MKRKIILPLAILGVTFGALAFSASYTKNDKVFCPLKGTPACPEYPGCCK